MIMPDRFSAVYVANPGGLWDKHKKFSFGIVIRFVGMVKGFPEPMYDVWIPDGNETRRVFSNDLRKFPTRRRKT